MRLAMIGCGGRGGLYWQWMKDPRVQLVAAADTGAVARAKFAEHAPDAFVTDDYRRVLDRDDVDAVAVCTPDFLHREHATAALDAGKHVFCEKPLATTIEDCDAILRAREGSGTKLMVGFNMRFMAFVCKMKELVDAGMIGDVKTVWTRHFVGSGGGWYFNDWHATRANTNGLLLQKASHDIDVMHWICGSHTVRTHAFGALTHFGGDEPDDLRCPDCDRQETCVEVSPATPEGVSMRDRCVFRREVDVEDVSMINMQFANGVLASYAQCHFAPDYERNYTFIGTEGRIESDEPNEKIRFWRRDPKRIHSKPDEIFDCAAPEGSHGGADPQIVQDFTAMVLDDTEPRVSPVSGRWSVAAGVCATHSLRNGGIPVDIPDLPEDLAHLA